MSAADTTVEAALQVAYDATRAQQMLDAAYEEIRNGQGGDYTGEQERQQLRPVDNGQFKNSTVPVPAPPPVSPASPAAATKWWWMWLVLALVLALVVACVVRR